MIHVLEAAVGGKVRQFGRTRAAIAVAPAVVALVFAGSAVAAIMTEPTAPTPDVPVAMSVQRFSVSDLSGADPSGADPSVEPSNAANQKTVEGASQPVRGGGFTAEQSTGLATVQWPLTSRDARITDGFGPRVPPCPVCSSNHRGQGFAGAEGEAVAAIANGKVVEVVPVPGASTLGVYVVIEHRIDGKQVHSVYAHLVSGSVTVRAGDEVRTGMQIGKLGNTGASTGPHLHLEILVNRIHVDPLAFLRTYADGKPVKIHTLPEIEWEETPDGAPRDDASDGWQATSPTPQNPADPTQDVPTDTPTPAPGPEHSEPPAVQQTPSPSESATPTPPEATDGTSEPTPSASEDPEPTDASPISPGATPTSQP